MDRLYANAAIEGNLLFLAPGHLVWLRIKELISKIGLSQFQASGIGGRVIYQAKPPEIPQGESSR